REVNGKPLVYLDNGATSQKPIQVIDAISNFYKISNANSHRGVHELSQRATDDYEQARAQIATFINARETAEIVFTRGTTEGINLVAQTWGRNYLKAGDEIVVTAMEHHANIVPWQMVCEETGAVLRVIPINDDGTVILDEARKLIGMRTRMLSVMHVSNALGTINPIDELLAMAREVGAMTMIDGAQAVPHFTVDVQALDCDFYVFSSHKMLGPSGVGVLYGKRSVLEQIPPFQGGGDMIKTVRFSGTEYADVPLKFEAGTPNIEGAIGLSAAITYWESLDHVALAAHEKRLLDVATQKLQAIEGLRIIGTAPHKVPVVSFLLDTLHPYDVGFILDKQGIAVRTGHHCAQPLMERFGIPGTIRASFAFYNTIEEIDRLVQAIERAKKMLL
ncbi:MAG: aminotransferase class V-fold PLP-dependent enzyme, partial [Bacteroidia bacterium]